MKQQSTPAVRMGCRTSSFPARLGRLLLSLMAAGSVGRAALIAYESFDYSTGTLVGQNGGTGWAGAWGNLTLNGGSQGVASPGLTHSDISEAGNKTTLAGSAASSTLLYRSLNTSYASGDIYLSFLGQRNTATSRAWGLSLADMPPSPSSPATPQGNLIGGAGTFFVGGSAGQQFTGIADNSVALLVAKANIDTGTISLWVYPDGTPPPSSQPLFPHATLTLGSLATFDGIRLFAGGDGPGVQSADLDELRIGTTWNDVTETELPAVVPVGYWQFNEIGKLPGDPVSSTAGALKDSGPNGYHLSAASGSPVAQYAAGPSAGSVPGAPSYSNMKSITFPASGPGLDDAVRLVDTAAPNEPADAFDFALSDSFTLEAIIRTSSHGVGDQPGAIVAKDWGANQPSWWLRVDGGKLRFLVADGQSHEPNVSSSVNVNDGGWHHVAAVRNTDSDQLLVYVDYLLVGSITDTTTASLANDQALVIGDFGNDNGNRRDFIGQIDMVRITRQALTPDLFLTAIIPEPGSLALLLAAALCLGCRGRDR